jgi:hypothetical protein
VRAPSRRMSLRCSPGRCRSGDVSRCSCCSPDPRRSSGGVSSVVARTCRAGSREVRWPADRSDRFRRPSGTGRRILHAGVGTAASTRRRRDGRRACGAVRCGEPASRTRRRLGAAGRTRCLTSARNTN